jgi:hypothetical protein
VGSSKAEGLHHPYDISPKSLPEPLPEPLSGPWFKNPYDISPKSLPEPLPEPLSGPWFKRDLDVRLCIEFLSKPFFVSAVRTSVDSFAVLTVFFFLNSPSLIALDPPALRLPPGAQSIVSVPSKQ